MKKLVIDRSRWLRGEGANDSALLRPKDQRMCCLGIYLQSCGVPADDLAGRKYPSSVHGTMAPEAAWTVSNDPYRGPYAIDNNPAFAVLATTNDNPKLAAREREQRITEVFAIHGVEVTFVDPTWPTPSKDGGA